MIKINAPRLEVFNNMILLPLNQQTSLELLKLREKGDKGYAIEIYTLEEKERRNRAKQPRSLSANNYMWLLCSMLADGLTKCGATITKEEVYRKNIREAFTPNNPYDNADNPICYSDHFKNELINDLIEQWTAKGTGWICEVDGPAAVYGRTYLNFWKGSSQFNRRQMAKLISAIQDDAEQSDINIHTQYDESLDKMLDDMERARERKSNGN